MKIKKAISLLAVLGLLIAPLLTLAVDAPPALPLLVYGSVKIDGSNAPVGTIISVQNNGVTTAQTTVSTAGQYFVEVSAVNVGATLTYKVGSLTAASAICADPLITSSVVLNLSATTPVCNPATIANGSISAYPACSITCNAGYNLSGGVCVVITSGGGGGGGGGGGSSNTTTTQTTPTTISAPVSSTNAPLTVSNNQAGTINYSFSDSTSAKIEVPVGSVNSATTFSVAQGSLTSAQTPVQTSGALMVGNTVFNINATDANSNAVRNFSGNLTITLVVPTLPVATTDLAVYYFNENSGEWLQVPGASFDAVNKKVVFTVTHLTKFAVFKATTKPAKLLTASTVANPPAETEGEVLGEKISDETAQFVAAQKKLVRTVDKKLSQRLAGRILLQAQSRGEAWYVDPLSQNRFYLADGARAYGALRQFGLGVANKDLLKIPVGLEARFLDVDTDGDGLADKLEEGLGTAVDKSDTDGDGVSDYDEVIKNKTNPLGSGALSFDNKLVNRLRGRIVLQVESRGEAWYINPVDGKRYYMKDGNAAYQIMRFLSLGITNQDIQKINIGD